MADNILSQDEIDALLSGMDGGEVELNAQEDLPRGGILPYDFESQDRIIRGRLPTLELINERLARSLHLSLFKLLRRAPEISVGAIQMSKFSEYLQGLLIPASMNLVRVKPLRGTALLTFDPKLVFALVDNFFGGNGQYPEKPEGREFTATELRMVRLTLDQILTDLEHAWAPVMPIELDYVATESNPHFANIVSPSEVVVVTALDIEVAGGGGSFHIAYPYSMLEPIRETLDAPAPSDAADRDERWARALQNEIETAEVEVCSMLTQTEISLMELSRLRAGDVIPVEIPETVFATVGGIPVFRGKFGTSGGNLALKVIETVRVFGTELAMQDGSLLNEQ